MGIDLNKRISLVKNTLDKKRFNGQVEVAIALDVSGSMSGMFRDGTAQDLIERMLAIGVNLDHNKKIDSYIFNHEFKKLPEITLENYNNYANTEIFDKGYVAGGTKYSPVLQAIVENHIGIQKSPQRSVGSGIFSLFSKKNKKEEINVQKANQLPLVIFFITDGDCWDSNEVKKKIIEYSKENVFIQFIGISQSSTSEFKFLEHLDNMTGRHRDNVNFFNSGTTRNLDDDELYEAILKEMPLWYKEITQ